jgi:hypothetical protein
MRPWKRRALATPAAASRWWPPKCAASRNARPRRQKTSRIRSPAVQARCRTASGWSTRPVRRSTPAADARLVDIRELPQVSGGQRRRGTSTVLAISTNLHKILSRGTPFRAFRVARDHAICDGACERRQTARLVGGLLHRRGAPHDRAVAAHRDQAHHHARHPHPRYRCRHRGGFVAAPRACSRRSRSRQGRRNIEAR